LVSFDSGPRGFANQLEGTALQGPVDGVDADVIVRIIEVRRGRRAVALSAVKA
jgi:hypothetical protein